MLRALCSQVQPAKLRSSKITKWKEILKNTYVGYGKRVAGHQKTNPHVPVTIQYFPGWSLLHDDKQTSSLL